MKLTRSTVALVAIALGLGLAVFVLERRPNESDDGPQPLFSFEEADIEAVTIDKIEETLTFEREEDGTWQMLEPQTGPASEAAVVYLLNLLVTDESSRRLPIVASEAADFGLDAPLAEINVTLGEDQAHQLILGDYNFSNQFIYALVDPPTKDSPPESSPTTNDDAGDRAERVVHLVSTNFDTAVNRPVEDWLDSADAAQTSPEASSESSDPDSEPVPATP